MSLRGKVAVVTGAGQGIGQAIAGRLAKEGAVLALVDVKPEGLSMTEQSVVAGGGRAAGFVANVAKKNDVVSAVEAIQSSLGCIDILVNNAGVIRDGFIEGLSEADWDDVIDVNLKGAFLFSQAVIAPMKKKLSGKIVNLSSRSWLGNIGQSNYAASKGGLVSLTRTLALELAKYQINVNAVAPGFIDTPMTRGLPEKTRERLTRMQPSGKIGSVNDIAAAVAFLVSDESSFITGQVLHVDGGKSCGLLSL